MRAIRSKDMKPELAVRRWVHAMGYRFRLHRKDLPGKPDLVFSSKKAVIFVNGCFWHQHPEPSCKDARLPKSNRDYWKSKLERNQIRDANNYANLKAAGWHVLVIWECETENELATKDRIKQFLDRYPAPPMPERKLD